MSHKLPRVFAGFESSFYVTENGDVYSFGSGSSGKLGHGDEHDRREPTRIKFFFNNHIQINKVICSQSMTFYRTFSGKWYCSGDLRHSGCENKLKTTYEEFGENEEVHTPVLHPFLRDENIVRVKLGGQFALYIKRGEQGEDLLFGGGLRRALGFGSDSWMDQGYPKCIKIFFGKIGAIGTGYTHYLVTDKDSGDLYGAGEGEYGQILGRSNLQSKLVKIPFFKDKNLRIRKIKCSLFSSFFLCEGGKVFACGKNDYGILGRNNKFNSHVPMEIVLGMKENLGISNIFCGERTVFLLPRDKKSIFACGQNFVEDSMVDGQSLLMTPTKVALNLNLNEMVCRVCAGSDHALCQTNLYIYGAGADNSHGKLSFTPKGKFEIVASLKKIDGISLKTKIWKTNAYHDVKIITKVL